MVLGMCERLSAKSCRSCGHLGMCEPAKSCMCGQCVNVFPLSHVDRVVNGPGYV